MTSRRTFLVTFTGGILGVPLASEAQPAGKIQRVGLLGLTSAAVLADATFVAFRAGLRDHGYVEGRSIVIESRWAERKPERLPQLAKELVDLKVDVVIVANGPAARAATQATSTVPIVFIGISDPVSAGLVSSLAHPGGNATGLSVEATPEQVVKQLEILREFAPKAKRVAVLQGHTFKSDLAPYLQYTQVAVRRLNLTLHDAEFHGPQDLETAFAGILAARADAVWVVGAETFLLRTQIADFATRNRLPSVAPFREFVVDGGLVSYGASLPDLYRRAAAYVDKILKGAKPGDLPVEQPTKFELVINLKTAKALGLTIPQSLLVRADEIIQ